MIIEQEQVAVQVHVGGITYNNIYNNLCRMERSEVIIAHKWMWFPNIVLVLREKDKISSYIGIYTLECNSKQVTRLSDLLLY